MCNGGGLGHLLLLRFKMAVAILGLERGVKEVDTRTLERDVKEVVTRALECRGVCNGVGLGHLLLRFKMRAVAILGPD